MGTKAPLLPLQVENESNVLQDGSLIDLCGATLLWRTPAGLLRAPTLKQLEAQRQESINQRIPHAALLRPSPLLLPSSPKLSLNPGNH